MSGFRRFSPNGNFLTHAQPRVQILQPSKNPAAACSGFCKRHPVVQLLDQYRGRLIPSRRCGKPLINKYVSNPLRAVGRGVCSSPSVSVPLWPSPYWQSSRSPGLYGGVSRPIVLRLLFWNALMSWHRAGTSGYAIWSRRSAALINHSASRSLYSCCIMRKSILPGRLAPKGWLTRSHALTPLCSVCMHTCLSGWSVLIPGCCHPVINHTARRRSFKWALTELIVLWVFSIFANDLKMRS